MRMPGRLLFAGVALVGSLGVARLVGETKIRRTIDPRKPSPHDSESTANRKAEPAVVDPTDGAKHDRKSESSAVASRGRKDIDLGIQTYRTALARPLDAEHLADLERTLRSDQAGLYEWQMALWALGRFDTPESVVVLKRYAMSTSPMSRRMEVVRRLGGMREPRALGALGEIVMRGPSDRLALSAAAALSARSHWDPAARLQVESLKRTVSWKDVLSPIARK